MRLSFYGAAQEVTGSNFLLETPRAKILIDCGLFQCPAFCEIRNDLSFPYNFKDIDACLITHSHIDHIGRLPKLVKDGFKGKIYSTSATRDFAEIMLLDSVGVLEKEARRKNRKLFYAEDDVRILMEQWEAVEYHQKFRISDCDIIFKDAGHILGSAIIEIIVSGGAAFSKKIVFTGDPTQIVRPHLDSISNGLVSTIALLAGAEYYGHLNMPISERDDVVQDMIERAKQRTQT